MVYTLGEFLNDPYPQDGTDSAILILKNSSDYAESNPPELLDVLIITINKGENRDNEHRGDPENTIQIEAAAQYIYKPEFKPQELNQDLIKLIKTSPAFKSNSIVRDRFPETFPGGKKKSIRKTKKLNRKPKTNKKPKTSSKRNLHSRNTRKHFNIRR